MSASLVCVFKRVTQDFFFLGSFFHKFCRYEDNTDLKLNCAGAFEQEADHKRKDLLVDE